MAIIQIRKSEKAMGEFSLFVSFPYNAKLVELIKAYPQRYYNKDTKEWEIPSLLLEKVKYDILSNGFPLTIYGAKNLEQNQISYNYEFKNKPLNHQLEAINYGLNKEQFLLGDDMGLGKTFESLSIACIRKQKRQVEKCLIVCGVNVLKWNWIEEIKKHTREKGWILGQRKNKKGKTIIGSTEDKIEDLNSLGGDNFFLITNIETFRNVDFVCRLEDLIRANKIQMIIVDEAHKIKNSKSQQTKGLLRMDAKYKIAMSGTFMLNRPLELFVPLNWIHYYKNSEWSFINTFTIKDNFGQPCGNKNMPLLSNMVKDCMLRRLKEDVLDSLPEKTYINELIEMTDRQKIIYDEVITGLKENIDMIKLSHNPLVEMIRARQATGYTGLLSSSYNESSKMDRLVDLVDEITANEYKCIVYSNWANMVEIASKFLSNYNPCIITGSYNESVINKEISRFKTDLNSKVCIGTIDKMGTGLTLTEANYVIFLDEPWNKGIKEQASDRVYRIGQKNNVTIITLLCKNTIDERINDLVEKKGMMSNFLIDGKIPTGSNIVDFLLN